MEEEKIISMVSEIRLVKQAALQLAAKWPQNAFGIKILRFLFCLTAKILCNAKIKFCEKELYYY